MRMPPDQGADAPRRGGARGDHQAKIAALGKRQHALRRRLDQARVAERAPGARDTAERLVGDAEAVAERAQIGFLIDAAGRDQHPVGAQPQRGRALVGRGDHAGGKQMTHAIELAEFVCGAGGRLRRARRHAGGSLKAGPRARQGRSATHTQRCLPHLPLQLAADSSADTTLSRGRSATGPPHWRAAPAGVRRPAMSGFMSHYAVPAAIVAVAIVLVLGLVNMMRGGSPNRSQKLMRMRVLLQFVAIIIIMATIWMMGR